MHNTMLANKRRNCNVTIYFLPFSLLIFPKTASCSSAITAYTPGSIADNSKTINFSIALSLVIIVCLIIKVITQKTASRKIEKNFSSLHSESLEQLRKSIDENQRLKQELKLAQVEAEIANMAKNEFLANISHEFFTPLNGVIGFVGSLMKDGNQLNEDQQESVSIALDCANNLFALVKDILDLANLETFKLTMSNKEFDMNSLLCDICNLARKKIEDRDIILLTNVEVVPTNLIGDPARVSQVIINIINNSIKFTDHGSIKIESKILAEDSDSLTMKFSISDTGIGMSEDKTKVIFHSFKQVDGSATRKYKGIGVGITIAKKLVEMMDGAMWVKSKPEVGSTFYFTARFTKAKEITVEENSEYAPLTNKETLVVTENDDDIKLIAKAINKVSGKSNIVNNEVAAIEQLIDTEYSVIFIDPNTFNANNTEASERFAELCENIPTIAIVEGTKQKTCSLSEEIINDYIPRPLTEENILRIIEKQRLGQKKFICQAGSIF